MTDVATRSVQGLRYLGYTNAHSLFNTARGLESPAYQYHNQDVSWFATFNTLTQRHTIMIYFNKIFVLCSISKLTFSNLISGVLDDPPSLRGEIAIFGQWSQITQGNQPPYSWLENFCTNTHHIPGVSDLKLYGSKVALISFSQIVH